MLSILIPTYHYNVYPLVSLLSGQCASEGFAYEIIVLDDASGGSLSENQQINSFPFASFRVLDQNIGRSRIRNLLADTAKYDWLLFLDADTMPVSPDFISNYAKAMQGEKIAVNGGIVYQQEKPGKAYRFRWTYGSRREAQPLERRLQSPYPSFLSLNFLIPKSLFNKVRFDETLPNLRHEDTVFSYQLMKAGVPVAHLHNPVTHLGLDTFETAIRKENDSLIALKYLLEHQRLAPDYIKMGRLYSFIRKNRLCAPVAFAFRLIRKPLLANLSGENPNMRLFDLYRIGYICTL